ncbi:nitrogen regulation protein NR(II) [Thermodesulfobacteriota bacterium]
MSGTQPPIINIAIVGGESYSSEIIEKTTLGFSEGDVSNRIKAIADTNPSSPGMLLGQSLGLITLDDYHKFYEPQYDIHLIIILTPEQRVLEDILETRPPHIRILSYHVFEIFWKAIGSEERKLRERTNEMETILNGIQDFILAITPDMEIVEVNEAFLSKMGYTREEVLGQKCYQVYHKIDLPCAEPDSPCPLKEVVRNQRECRQIQTRIGSDGEKRYFEVNVYPVWEKDGKISKFIHISRDVTQRLKEEEEITRRLESMVEERTSQLKESHEKLLHQDKMASLGKLSASVVHEINNPIAGILNLTMLIKRMLRESSYPQSEDRQFKRYLDLMETETRRISRIVSNLLAFSRQAKLALQRLNLNKLIEKTLFLNSNLLKINGVKVTKKLEPRLPEIFGSEDQLQQVFMNIISNAAEVMEANGGGLLTVESQNISKRDKIVISFTDTGLGIARENYSKLFEPFFTTKKEGKGVGLGLSVAYGIIEEHGGSIQVKSKANQGTTFEVYLPVKQPPGSLEGHGGLHGQY